MAEAVVEDIGIELSSGTGNTIVFLWRVYLFESDGETKMLYLDGATATFKVKRSYGTTDPIVSISTDDGITINDSSGYLEVALTKTHLASIQKTTDEIEYKYDLDLIDSANQFYRIRKGTVTFYGDL